MKKNNFVSLAATALLVCICGGVVWGQNQQWYPFVVRGVGDTLFNAHTFKNEITGKIDTVRSFIPKVLSNGAYVDDYSNPILDPFLLNHAMYGKTSIDGNGVYIKLSRYGITGTSGTINPVGQLYIENTCGVALLQNIGSVSGWPGLDVVGSNTTVYFGSSNKLAGQITGAIDKRGTIQGGQGCRVAVGADVQLVSNVYSTVRTIKVPTGDPIELLGRNPMFPDLDKVNFSNPPAGVTRYTSIASTMSITAGVYFIDGNINLNPGKTLTITADSKGSFKTIIYVSGDVDIHTGKIVVNKSEDNTDQCIGKESDVLFLVKGDVLGDIGSSARATIISNKTIKSVASSKYIGQILADKISFTNEYDATQNITFAKFPTTAEDLGISPGNNTFKEDKNWSNYPNKNSPEYKYKYLTKTPAGKDTIRDTSHYWYCGKKDDYYDSVVVMFLDKSGNAILLKDGESATYRYTITNKGAGRISTNEADARVNGCYLIVTQSGATNNGGVISGEITMGAGSLGAAIKLKIIDDDDTVSVRNFELKLDKINSTITAPDSKTFNMEILSDDPDLSAYNKPTLSGYDSWDILESFTNGSEWWKAGTTNNPKNPNGGSKWEDLVGKLPSKSSVGLTASGGFSGKYAYEITSNPNNWFKIDKNGQITIDRSNYTDSSADYEKAAKSYNLKVVAIDSALIGCGNDKKAIGTSAEKSITVNILPWNDNKLVVKNVNKSINEGDAVTIVDSDWYVSEADLAASPYANIREVVGVSTSKEISISPSTTNSEGVKITLANGNVTCDTKIPGKIKNNECKFYITVRDYMSGYNNSNGISGSDYYDQIVEVTVNIKSVDKFAPEVDTGTIKTIVLLHEDDSASVKISSMTIIDRDEENTTSDASHWTPVFVSDPLTSYLKDTKGISSIGLRIDSKGELVYSLKNVPASQEFQFPNAIFVDTIYFKVKSQSQTSETYNMRVTITPRNDNAPKAQSFTVSKDIVALTGMSTEISQFSDKVTDADYTNNGRQEDRWEIFTPDSMVKIGNVKRGKIFDAHGTDITNMAGLEAQKTGDKVVKLTIPSGYKTDEHGDSLWFEYNVKDIADYDDEGRRNESAVEKVVIRVERSDVEFIDPIADTIIVNQGGSAYTLHDGRDKIWTNDVWASGKLDPVIATEVKLVSGSKGSCGELRLDKGGTFEYTHDGSTPGSVTPHDEYWYAVRCNDESGDVWSDNVLLKSGATVSRLGRIVVLVNRNEKEDTREITNGREYKVNADAERKFPAIVIGEDKDTSGATLYLDSVKLSVNDGRVKLDFENNNVVFKYEGEIDDTINVKVKFWVSDSLKVMQFHFKDGGGLDTVWVNISSGSNEYDMNIIVIPNPKAFPDSMSVIEMRETDEFIDPKDPKGGKYKSVNGNDKFFKEYENAKGGSVKYVLVDSTKYGDLTFIQSTGAARYKHTNSAGLKDTFTYYIEYIQLYGADTARNSDTARVVIQIKEREPYALKDRSFYYDTNADGTVDKITIPFDRPMNRKYKDYVVTFETQDGTVSPIAYIDDYPRENGAVTDSSVVILYLETAPIDAYGNNIRAKNLSPKGVTGGTMTVKVIHEDFDDGYGKAPEHDVDVIDKAAPVIKAHPSLGDTAIYIRSLSDGQDTLLIYLTEKASPRIPKDSAFKFIRMKDEKVDGEYAVSFQASKMTNYGGLKQDTLVISVNNHKDINKGDSVRIDYTSKVIEDGSGNIQTNPKNKSVYILMKETVTLKDSAATYYDSSTYYGLKGVCDGYVDLIRIDVGTKIDKATADTLSKALKYSRGFKPDSVRLGNNGVSDSIIWIYGSESKARVVRDTVTRRDFSDSKNKDYRPNTAVGSDDSIYLESAFNYGGHLTVKGAIRNIKDSVAPVVLYGIYNVPKKADKKDTTLEVVFSEKTFASAGNPYKFITHKDRGKDGKGKDYQIKLSSDAPTPKLDSAWTYKVVKVEGITYPLKGDSIWISTLTKNLKDGKGNIAEETVHAILINPNGYEEGSNSQVVPNPIGVNKDGNVSKIPDEIVKHYNLKEVLNPDGDKPDYDRGTLIVVEINGPTADISKQKDGEMRILDQTGNLVFKCPLKPTIAGGKDGKSGTLAFVGVWNGKNSLNRTVGPSSYLSLTQGEVVYEDKGKVPYTGRNVILVISGDGKSTVKF